MGFSASFTLDVSNSTGGKPFAGQLLVSGSSSWQSHTVDIVPVVSQTGTRFTGEQTVTPIWAAQNPVALNFKFDNATTASFPVRFEVFPAPAVSVPNLTASYFAIKFQVTDSTAATATFSNTVVVTATNPGV